ncbi:MAG: ribbon-helix-helix domain-containing protein [Candidatus Thermoplasmatota archaeon]
MEKVQVRFPPEDLRKIEKEVEEGKYPNKSEAIRDKVRKSYILEAIIYMKEATEGLDEEEELEKLEKTREKKYEE